LLSMTCGVECGAIVCRRGFTRLRTQSVPQVCSHAGHGSEKSIQLAIFPSCPPSRGHADTGPSRSTSRHHAGRNDVPLLAPGRRRPCVAPERDATRRNDAAAVACHFSRRCAASARAGGRASIHRHERKVILVVYVYYVASASPPPSAGKHEVVASAVGTKHDRRHGGLSGSRRSARRWA